MTQRSAVPWTVLGGSRQSQVSVGPVARAQCLNVEPTWWNRCAARETQSVKNQDKTLSHSLAPKYLLIYSRASFFFLK